MDPSYLDQAKARRETAATLPSPNPSLPNTLVLYDRLGKCDTDQALESPIGSPMRISSAGGNRNIMTSQVFRSGVESSQRSPINFGTFPSADAYMEHYYHNICEPSLAGGSSDSSLNSSLAPPTPMSPRGGMALVQREGSRSTSPYTLYPSKLYKTEHDGAGDKQADHTTEQGQLAPQRYYPGQGYRYISDTTYHNSHPSSSEHPEQPDSLETQIQHSAATENHALQDYRAQSMLLEQQIKKRLLLSQQAQVQDSPAPVSVAGSAVKSSRADVAAMSGFLPTPPRSRTPSPREFGLQTSFLQENQWHEQIKQEESPLHDSCLYTVGSSHPPGVTRHAHSAALQRQVPTMQNTALAKNLYNDAMNNYGCGSEGKKRRGRPAPPGRCHSCNRSETPEWRRGPSGARTLCNACGLHYAKTTMKSTFSIADQCPQTSRFSSEVGKDAPRVSSLLKRVEHRSSLKREIPGSETFYNEICGVDNTLGTGNAGFSSTRLVVHCNTTSPCSEELEETQDLECGQAKALTPLDDGSANNHSPSSFTEDDTDGVEDEDNSVLNFQIDDLFALSKGKSCSQSETDTDVNLIRPVLSPMKQGMIDRIMKEFWSIWDGECVSFRGSSAMSSPIADSIKPIGDPTMNECVCDGCESSSIRSRSESTNSAASPNQKSGDGKPRKRERDDENDPEQNPEDNKTPKRSKSSLCQPETPEKRLKFACPYRKRDPRKYCVRHWRSCALTPLDDVARVKGHLYRHHRIFPCRRCKELFKDQDAVNSHLERSEGCELKTGEVADGVTADIVDKLRNKRTGQRTERQRWEDIYKLLFPYALIPSPYFEDIEENVTLSPDSRDLADYEDYCRRELPLVFRTALEQRIQNESQPIEESIRNQLMEIIRDCQDQVSSRYRSSTGASSGRRSQTPTSSQSLTIARNSSNDSILNTDATSQVPAITPFFQPPPPQNHLQSRLDISEIQDSASKLKETHEQSDSGYGSCERVTEHGSSSASEGTSNDTSLPSSQNQLSLEPAPNGEQNTLDAGALDQMRPGIRLLDAEQSDTFNDGFEGLFDSSWYDPQLAPGSIWDPNMENQFA